MTDIYGIKGLNWSIVMNSLPMLSKSAQDDINRAAAYSPVALQAALDRHKPHILMVLGFEVPETKAATRAESVVLEAIRDYLGISGAYSNMGQAVRSAEGQNPDGFYLWVKTRMHPEKGLQRLYEAVGECSPALAAYLSCAPDDVPLSVYLTVAVDEAAPANIPDVPESFMVEWEDLQSGDDMLEAYIRSCLCQFWNKQSVLDVCQRYKSVGLSRYFPCMVWELMGRKVNGVEKTIF